MHTMAVYTAHMGYESVKVWVCDVCGHRWIAGELVPTHCASSKCRSRKWDNTPSEPTIDVPITFKSPINLIIPPDVRLRVRPDHDPKTCRVYKCGLCAAITNDK